MVAKSVYEILKNIDTPLKLRQLREELVKEKTKWNFVNNIKEGDRCANTLYFGFTEFVNETRFS